MSDLIVRQMWGMLNCTDTGFMLEVWFVLWQHFFPEISMLQRSCAKVLKCNWLPELYALAPNGICQHLWCLHKLHKLEVNTVTYCAGCQYGKNFLMVALSLMWFKLRAAPLLDTEKCLWNLWVNAIFLRSQYAWDPARRLNTINPVIIKGSASLKKIYVNASK